MTMYASRPVEVEARQWDGRVRWSRSPANSGHQLQDALAIVAWVNAEGGEARYEKALRSLVTDVVTRSARIAVRTAAGWVYAKPGDYVVMGDVHFHVDGQPTGAGCRDVRDFIVVSDLADLRVKHEWVPADQPEAERQTCDHGQTKAHEAIRCTVCGGSEWELTRHPDCFAASCQTCKGPAMDIGWGVARYTTCPGPAARPVEAPTEQFCPDCGGSGNASTFDGYSLDVCSTCTGDGLAPTEQR